MMANGQCLDGLALQNFLDSELDDMAAELTFHHLERCPRCAAVFGQLRELKNFCLERLGAEDEDEAAFSHLIMEKTRARITAALAAQRESEAKQLWWRSISWSWRPLAVAAGVMLVLGIGIFIWSSRREPAPQISQSRPQPAPAADVERRAPTGTDVKSSVQPTPQARPMLTPTAPKTAGQRSRLADLLAINVDLNDYSSLAGPRRGGVGSEEEKAIRLPRARARLELKLPPNSDPGRYRVSIMDAYLRPVIGKPAISQDGDRLTVELDLRRLPQRSYYLRLTHGDEAPGFYRVSINTE